MLPKTAEYALHAVVWLGRDPGRAESADHLANVLNCMPTRTSKAVACMKSAREIRVKGMSETIVTIEDAATRLPELVDRVHSQREAAVITRAGEPIARIVPLPTLGDATADLIVFLRRWRHEHPEPDEGFAEAVGESREVGNPECARVSTRRWSTPHRRFIVCSLTCTSHAIPRCTRSTPGSG